MAKAKKDLNRMSKGSNLFANIFFIIIVIVCLAPLLLVVAISLTDETELLTQGYSFIPQTFSFHAYTYVLAAGDAIVRAYAVSIFVTVVGTICSLLFISMYAYPLSRPNFKYRNKFAFFAYFTMIFGGGLVPWYIVYTQLVPISHSVWILIVPYLLNAWYVLIMRTFIKTT
ncbi:MAG: carbohydrate ABC transporter permease, partial [Clostridiales bacterium]|nr:carbohydrate ABC transporter permease [Clostridiales bacterium]